MMFCSGSVRSFTPKRSAVSGISCMSPTAPVLEMASGLNADSAVMIASISAASTWLACAAAAMKGA